jgi:catechol 2,3-dioxygenase-like lactoylglutathione lyase family enzyme
MTTKEVQKVDAWPRGIGAITLFVDDLAAAKEFYSKVFGLPVAVEEDDAAVFNFGNTLINLLHVESAAELVGDRGIASRSDGARHQFTIEVDDVDAACAELTSRGVEFLIPPTDRPWGARTASFTDPSGHIWEIANFGANRTLHPAAVGAYSVA